jgi:hypothetical protein
MFGGDHYLGRQPMPKVGSIDSNLGEIVRAEAATDSLILPMARWQ